MESRFVSCSSFFISFCTDAKRTVECAEEALIERYKEIEDLKARLAERDREVVDVGRRGSVGVKRRLLVREVGSLPLLEWSSCSMGWIQSRKWTNRKRCRISIHVYSN